MQWIALTPNAVNFAWSRDHKLLPQCCTLQWEKSSKCFSGLTGVWILIAWGRSCIRFRLQACWSSYHQILCFVWQFLDFGHQSRPCAALRATPVTKASTTIWASKLNCKPGSDTFSPPFCVCELLLRSCTLSCLSYPILSEDADGYLLSVGSSRWVAICECEREWEWFSLQDSEHFWVVI